jgi:Mg-chelatase subunit ChlD
MPPQNPHVAQGNWKGKSTRFRRDRLIVSVNPGYDVQSTLGSVVSAVTTRLGVAPDVVHPPGRRWAILLFPSHPQAETEIPDIAETLSSLQELRYAEPDFEGRGHLVPQDDEYMYQTAWTSVIGLEVAWGLTKGKSDVLLAVLDSGIPISAGATDPDHVELDGPRFIVRHTLSGANVYHDYAEGGNPRNGPIVRDDIPADEHGHGTHVTGIIAAEATEIAHVNSDGIAGINWVSPVYIARVINENNTTYASWIKLAMEDLIAYAADKKYTRVIVNLSLGVKTDADSMTQMCEETDKGTFLLCVGPDLDSVAVGLDYPGAFAAGFQHVIAVGVVDGTNIKGPMVDDYSVLTLFAPGMDIVSVAPGYACTLWDPADSGWDAYPKLSGPSQAAAIVTGVASLLWSQNLKLTPAQIKECLLHTADPFTDGSFDGKRVNAANAVTNAAWTVSLDTPHLTFVDVAVGEVRSLQLQFTIQSCTTLNFEVVAGSDAGLPASLAVTARTARYDPDTDGTTFAGIIVSYTAGAAGSVAFGGFTVSCVETGDTWAVFLTANTESPVRSAVVLVADRSGSMSQPSGVGGLTRMDVLQYSADILVDTMRVGDGLGIVSFEGDPALVSAMTNIASEATNSAERTALRNAIATLAPGGSTSIGDGVAVGDATVAPAPQARKALLVLTDGYENTPLYIADVIGSISATVYAIGMGTAAVIQPAALSTLTTSSGGYVVLTDTMDDSTRYKVAKYLVQMLGNVTGASLVLDPGGYLRPGMIIEVPFAICGEDREFTAILMMAASAYASYEILTPRGVVVATGMPGGNVRFSPGRQSSCWRVRLPLGEKRDGEQAGMWRARFSISPENFERYRLELHSPGRGIAQGLPYEFVVLSESNLRLTTRVESRLNAVGSTVAMSAVLTSRGLPLDGASASALVVWPDGTKREHALQSVGRGAYEASFVATQEGVYPCRVRVRGYTPKGDPFTREQTMTAHIWNTDTKLSLENARAREAEFKPRTE